MLGRTMEDRMSDEKELAIASNRTTLEDYLKTKVCSGLIIHCQFPYYKDTFFIKRRMKEIGVKAITFSDGTELSLS